MFSLIITIISIALVAALAVATIYYGGDAFNQGSSKAKASTVVNQAQQIVGANTLLRANTGSYGSTVAELTAGGYLAAAPATENLTWSEAALAADNELTGTGSALTDEVCAKVNEVAGRASTVPTAKQDAQFGCYENASVNTFFFKG